MVYIIAEAGSNHDGDFERAKKLCGIAKEAGADAVKFQLIGDFKKEWIDPLIEYCKEIGIEFMATPFNQNGIDALKGKVNQWKIASTEAADPEFVKKVLEASGDSTVFISDGAVDDPNVFLGKNVVPLMCVIKYPAKEEDYFFNYRGMWGVSDHTESIDFGAYCVNKGALVLEKHFTDDRKRKGPDHSYALEPHELQEYIRKASSAGKVTIKDYVGRKIEWQ